MNSCRFDKITPVNGFDALNPDNAMQNNYAWSMAEFSGYIYVGTGRNIPYSAMVGMGITPPPELTPVNPSNTAEIWRYPLNGRCKKWERVYKAPQGSGLMGFRYMITFTDDDGVNALYCAGFGTNTAAVLLMTTNGYDFNEVSAGIPTGFSTRTMAIHKNKLYTGATNALNFSTNSYLFVTENPSDGWNQINFGTGDIPTGEVVSMISFNGYLYIGTSPAGGFEVWKSANPESGRWQLVVDKGAGDALNEVPMSMEIFKDHLYVGTGIWIGIQSVDPDKTIVPPKGFDVIRINKKDKWKVVVGSTPIAPTEPTTGKRNQAKCPSGFGSIFNAYCWQIRAYRNTLFIGSWDAAILDYSIIKNALNQDNADNTITNDQFSVENVLKMLSQFPITIKSEYNWFAWMLALIKSIPKYPCQFGFDLWESNDGENFCDVSLDGFHNKYNYGLRTMIVTEDNSKLFLGTANPYEGCEVWQLKCNDSCYGNN